jgi:GalNAc-alpha-(1->4)-GalNAc-alpha-(1->3)-diNAcBac-PP-undecaprenol alpha-1,4-N-acetyl-D-galactosaminyltransferase
MRMVTYDFVIFIGSLKKGGVERFAALLANYLVDNGHTVKMLMLKNEIAFDLDQRVQCEVVDYKSGRLRFLNIIYVYFSLLVKVWVYRPKRLITLARISGLFASATFYPKTIVMFDIYPLIGYKKYKQWQFWFFYNLPWVKYVVSCSQELKDDVVKYFFLSNKIKVIPYPVPLINTNDINASSLHPRPYFIVVARMSRQKNIDQIIKTYTKFGLHSSIDLLVLGDGPEMKHLKRLVSSLNMETHIFLKGFIRAPYPYIKVAKCLISASMREGFPNILVESLGLGTPVICSKAKTGPNEIIFHGENGLLFEVNDYTELGRLMKLVVEDASQYQHLKNNTSIGLDRFTHDKVMRDWMKILN